MVLTCAASGRKVLNALDSGICTVDPQRRGKGYLIWAWAGLVWAGTDGPDSGLDRTIILNGAPARHLRPVTSFADGFLHTGSSSTCFFWRLAAEGAALPAAAALAVPLDLGAMGSVSKGSCNLEIVSVLLQNTPEPSNNGSDTSTSPHATIAEITTGPLIP